MSDASSSSVLDYGRAPPARWRRLVRWTIVALLLVALAFAGLFAVRSLSLVLARREGYAKVTAWYQRARTSVVPAGTLLYSEAAADAGASAVSKRLDGTRYVTFDQGWPMLRTIGCTGDGVPNVYAFDVLYVHEHSQWVTPRGSRPMLLCVGYIGLDVSGQPRFQSQSFDFAVPMSRFQIASMSSSTSVQTPVTRSLFNLRIFAGAPDPADPTRFALPFTCDGGAGRFEFQTDVDVSDGGLLAPSVTIAWDDVTPTTRPS